MAGKNWPWAPPAAESVGPGSLVVLPYVHAHAIQYKSTGTNSWGSGKVSPRNDGILADEEVLHFSREAQVSWYCSKATAKHKNAKRYIQRGSNGMENRIT